MHRLALKHAEGKMCHFTIQSHMIINYLQICQKYIIQMSLRAGVKGKETVQNGSAIFKRRSLNKTEV